MDFIFDDNLAVVCCVGNQLIGRLKLDVIAIAPELGHQIDTSMDNAVDAREPGQDVENLPSVVERGNAA